ncbi:MurR/RpiR family transcriptional regulator [Allobaculum mucilyticum]|uniref:MurR/RpiR family transcriptional regulator n=1 Tax=Allobaculum mucilyticum TaxID=2834459 RepID=UPI001E3F8D6E|nr:MurR/RpiR family transcriptional regulator [Allobaculum mucilyticum]UNT95575.1 MurR/RpiR family transcriptional regulator [Allobaculum mucilyticum]
MNFFQQIKVSYDGLNETEKEMASFLVSHTEDLCALSINDMAKMLQSSRSSVLRLAQKLGYRGYSQMKYEMQQALDAREVIPQDLVDQYRYDVLRTFDMCAQVNYMPLLKAIDSSNRLIIYATGFVQNNYSKQFSSELFLYGKPNHLISGETNFEIIARTLTPDDLVIIVSLSGETPHLRNIVNLLNIRKVPICSVTMLSKNFLSDRSQYSLHYEVSPLPLQAEGAQSMNALSVTLTVLARKYLEYAHFDEV